MNGRVAGESLLLLLIYETERKKHQTGSPHELTSPAHKQNSGPKISMAHKQEDRLRKKVTQLLEPPLRNYCLYERIIAEGPLSVLRAVVEQQELKTKWGLKSQQNVGFSARSCSQYAPRSTQRTGGRSRPKASVRAPPLARSPAGYMSGHKEHAKELSSQCISHASISPVNVLNYVFAILSRTAIFPAPPFPRRLCKETKARPEPRSAQGTGHAIIFVIL